MARPERHDVDYFPFIVKDGRTLRILESKYDCRGVGFFTNLFRFLSGRPDHHFSIADESDRMWFFTTVKCDEESGIDMLNIMSKTGKIDKDLWAQKVIASQDFLDSITDAYRNRKNPIVTMKQIKVLYGVSDVRNTHTEELPMEETTREEQIDEVSYADNPQTKRKEKKRNKGKKFLPPTLDEVKQYCQERRNGVNPQKWIDHYTSNGWKVGKNKMVDWKAAVRTWEDGNSGNNGAGTSEALKAWRQVIEAVQRYGSNRTKPFEDPKINATVNLLTGKWLAICNANAFELNRLKGQFIDLYEAGGSP